MSASFTVWHHIKDKGSLSPRENIVETGILYEDCTEAWANTEQPQVKRTLATKRCKYFEQGEDKKRKGRGNHLSIGFCSEDSKSWRYNPTSLIAVGFFFFFEGINQIYQQQQQKNKINKLFSKIITLRSNSQVLLVPCLTQRRTLELESKGCNAHWGKTHTEGRDILAHGCKGFSLCWNCPAVWGPVVTQHVSTW